jgi:hypothetical protein
MENLGLARLAGSEQVNHYKIDMENQDDYLSTLEDLEAARNQLSNYQSLLQDLPELYERKFEERLRPIRDRNRALSQEGAGLRDQLDRALPAAHQPQRPGLPAATDAPTATQSELTAETPAVPSTRSKTLLPIGLAGASSLILLATLAPLANWMRHVSPPPKKAPAWSEAKTEGSTPTLSARGANAPLAGGSPKAKPPSSAPQTLLQPPASGPPAPIHPNKPPAPVAMASPGELILTASAPTWLEVHDADDHPLIAETFQGQRRIPLGQGLRLLAGRPDLITIQLPGTPPRRLGSIDAVDWQTIKPTQPQPVQASHRTAAPAAQGTRPSTPPGRSVAPTLVVQASEPSWIEVRGINGDAIYAGLVSGQRRFPLGKGLEVLSGRADAISVAIDPAAPKRLGTIDDLGWHRFTPPASRPAVATPNSALPPTPTQLERSQPQGAKPQTKVSLWESLGIPPFFSPRQPANRQPAKVVARPIPPALSRDPKPAAEALTLRASEPTWLEVRDANNRPLLAETFQGQRTIPLGKGLSVLAGRPDLLTVQRQGKPPKRLGGIDDLHWFRFSPASKPRSTT